MEKKMTNEEKAREIFCQNCINNELAKCKESCVGYTTGTKDLVQMAEWKDEEMEKKLLYVCEKHCLPNIYSRGKACAFLSMGGEHCWDGEIKTRDEARKEGSVRDACEASESKMMIEAYKCIHGYLHYEYSARGKSGERVLEDIKRYCVEQANKLRKAQK